MFPLVTTHRGGYGHGRQVPDAGVHVGGLRHGDGASAGGGLTLDPGGAQRSLRLTPAGR